MICISLAIWYNIYVSTRSQIRLRLARGNTGGIVPKWYGCICLKQISPSDGLSHDHIDTPTIEFFQNTGMYTCCDV